MSKKKKNFVNNKDLLEEIKKSKQRMRDDPDIGANAMTQNLVSMLMVMVERYFSKPNWSGYSWVEEFKADSILLLCNKWHKFDETKWSNPFAYYTTLIYTSALGTLEKEKKIQMVRDNVLESRGLTPSFGRQIENEKHLSEAMDKESSDYPTSDDEDRNRDGYETWSDE